MKIITRQVLIWSIILLPKVCLGFDTNYDSLGGIFFEQAGGIFFEQADRLKFENPDSSIILHNKSLDIYRHWGDTVSVIKVLVSRSYLQGHNGSFGEAYDGYWEALLLADVLDDPGSRSSVYYGLGWLHMLYNRGEKAASYFNQCLKIDKERVSTLKVGSQRLIDDYYSLLTLYRKQSNTAMARQYADSCQALILNNDHFVSNNAYLKAERGYLLFIDKKYSESLETLLPLEEYFTENIHSYLVVYHFFLGEIYQAQDMFEESKKYYLSAIQAGKKHKSHSDLTPEIYLQLSNLLYKHRDYQTAFETLKVGTELNELRFGSRSAGNQHFLEIKDEFRTQKDEKVKFEQAQRLRSLEQEKTISSLEVTILYVTIAFLIVLMFILYRLFRARYKAKKRLLYERRNHERLKAKEVLEVKNKELTASALHVIQKEEMLAELKDDLMRLKNNPDSNEINRLAKNINTNTSNSWKEFETRFISVNKSFYSELNKRFPSLSQGDQKICALIKLNFSSKDMSRLLGISVESVHTSRYRLRKKLGVDKNANLSDFIAKI